MSAYFVYMLRCRGDVYYTGLTTDVARRYRLHASGKGAKFTRSHPPQSIAAVWQCEDKVAAAKVEYAIKKHLTRPEKPEFVVAVQPLNITKLKRHVNKSANFFFIIISKSVVFKQFYLL